MTSKEIILALEQAAQANKNDRCRQGNIVFLRGPGDVIMTGDLHGNEKNFDRIIHLAQLDKFPNRHLILHELIHNPLITVDRCNSHLLLARAALLKVQFPHQVHFLLSNHDMAQVTRNEILKNGVPMVRALIKDVQESFGQNAPFIIEAIDAFLLTFPLAVRTDNHIWMSHSLPGERSLEVFEDDIFKVEITTELMKTDASLRALAWDRRHSEGSLAKLAQNWQATMFITGHIPQVQGFERPFNNLLILASDHAHGCFVQFDLEYAYQPDDIIARVKPLASIALRA